MPSVTAVYRRQWPVNGPLVAARRPVLGTLGRKLYRKMAKEGAKPGRVHQVHRTIRAALNEAKRCKHIHTNPAELARAPKLDEEEVERYGVDEIKKILMAAQAERNSAMGDRARPQVAPGESLDMKWEDVDLENGTLIVRRSRLRPKFKHGCPTPCGRRYGGHCPQAHPAAGGDGVHQVARRPPRNWPDQQVVTLLLAHQRRQDAERRVAHELWRETGYVLDVAAG